jgi:hypothetical protein
MKTSLLPALLLAASPVAVFTEVAAQSSATVTVATTVSTAPDAPTPVNPDELNKLAKPPANAGDLIEKERDTFLKENGIDLGGPDKKGRFFYWASNSVDAPATSSDWGKLRVIAFDKAMLKAQSDFVKDMWGKQVVEAARHYFHDQSTDATEFPDEGAKQPQSILGAVAKKAVALTEAHLDKALEEMGLNPADYSAKPPPQKRTLFLDQFVKKCAVKAIGSVSGLLVVQTFTGNDEGGHHSVGVLMMYSPAMRQLADDINRKKTPLLTGTPKLGIREMIPEDKAVLSETFGVRVGFDTEGHPCILSYGQWSNGGTSKDTRRIERARESTEQQALSLADSYITVFQNASMSYLDENITGSASEETLTKDGDGNISTGFDAAKAIDIINRRTKLTAKADMLGRSTVKKWSHITPGGQRIQGVVRAWTVANLAAGNAVRDWKPSPKPAPAPAPAPPPPQDSGVRRGAAQDLNDF